MNGAPMPSDMIMAPPAHDPLSWIVVTVGIIATLYTIIMGAYWLIRPGETESTHVKTLILRDNR